MGTRDEWDAVAARLRVTADPFQEPEFATLWDLANADAPQLLARYRKSGWFDEPRVADLVGNVLLNSLVAVLHADNPQAYFGAALMNAAKSWLRRGSSKVAAPPVVDSPHEPRRATPPPDHELRIDVANFLETLSERERAVMVGVLHDEDRVVLARRLGISRANLDQIVSRARRRFREEEP